MLFVLNVQLLKSALNLGATLTRDLERCLLVSSNQTVEKSWILLPLSSELTALLVATTAVSAAVFLVEYFVYFAYRLAAE